MRLSWRKRKNGEYKTQPSYDWKKFGHKIFKANQIARFFFTKFQHHDQHQNQYHDWNLLYKFWLQITFGVLSKVSLKVKVNLFKISNIILPSICRHGNVNFKATYVHFLLLIIIYILFKFQMPDEKIWKLAFIFIFTYSKNQGFLTDISL